jgi:hypothetical protein
MKMHHGIALLATGALLAAALMGIGSLSAGKAWAEGHKGAYPQGCVDCHKAGGVDDIGELLSGLGHRNVDDKTSKVPGDCVECHSDEGGSTPLSEAVHLVHFENPDRNPFVQDYAGNCLHCHALDAKTGVVTVKSGPKNW